jgi:diacylglycerol kinase family enzyme
MAPSSDDRSQPQETAIPGPRPTGAGRIAVVVNGNAQSVSDEVISTLDQILDAGDLYVSRRIEDAGAIAKSLIDRGYDTILTGGGDGTFTVVVTSVVREAERRNMRLPRFGLLRLGTGNSLAWVVGASVAGKGPRVAKALSADIARLRADAGSRLLPLVEVEGMLSPFCGFGVDAIVLRDYAATKSAIARGPLRRVLPGIAAYGIAAVTRTLPSYLLRPASHCRIRNVGSDALRIGERGAPVGSPIRAGELIYEGPATITALSTIPYYGFGFRMFPYADDRPGMMQLRVSTVRTFSFIKHFSDIWRGEYYNPEELFDFFVDEVEIEVDPPTSFQVGGDVLGDRAKIRAKLHAPVPVVDFYAPPRGE